ncbi:hypothetical protein BC567DRAFT_227740 [Phyllosticta citribraziliensis]
MYRACMYVCMYSCCCDFTLASRHSSSQDDICVCLRVRNYACRRDRPGPSQTKTLATQAQPRQTACKPRRPGGQVCRYPAYIPRRARKRV